DIVLGWPTATKIEVRAPLVQGRKGEFRELFENVRKQGFIRAYVDGELIEVANPPKLNRRQNHDISVVVDRLVVRSEDRGRLTDSIETALKLADGIVEVMRADTGSRPERSEGTGSRHPERSEGTGSRHPERSEGSPGSVEIFSERYGCPSCGISL